MRSAPVAPVITGNIATRKRSTSPARSSDRHKLRLLIVPRAPSHPHRPVQFVTGSQPGLDLMACAFKQQDAVGILRRQSLNEREEAMYSTTESFYDAKGILRAPGDAYYDSKGTLREPEYSFWDYAGRYRAPSESYSDSKRQCRFPSDSFYDGKGVLRRGR